MKDPLDIAIEGLCDTLEKTIAKVLPEDAAEIRHEAERRIRNAIADCGLEMLRLSGKLN